jgi:hypothetical protein
VIAIAGVLLNYADPDGRHCRPAIETIRWQAGVGERTVVLVLAWLLDNGWLEVVKRTRTRPTEYRLTIPVGADEHLAGTAPEQDQMESPVLPGNRTGNGPGPVAGPVAGTAPQQDDLRTSVVTTEEDEEEESFAPSADAPVAPLKAPTINVKAITADIGRELNDSIGSNQLTAALIHANTVRGWRDAELTAYGVDKLRQNPQAKNRSAWLATDLMRVDANTAASPRMELAQVLADLHATDHTWREVAADGNPDATGGPLERFEDMLVKAGVIKEGHNAPSLWGFKDTDIAKATTVAGFVLTKFGLARDLSLKGIDNVTFDIPPEPEEDR